MTVVEETSYKNMGFAALELRATGPATLPIALHLAAQLGGTPVSFWLDPARGLVLLKKRRDHDNQILQWTPESFATQALAWLAGLSPDQISVFDPQRQYPDVSYEGGAYTVSAKPDYTNDEVAVIAPVWRDVHK